MNSQGSLISAFTFTFSTSSLSQPFELSTIGIEVMEVYCLICVPMWQLWEQVALCSRPLLRFNAFFGHYSIRFYRCPHYPYCHQCFSTFSCRPPLLVPLDGSFLDLQMCPIFVCAMGQYFSLDWQMVTEYGSALPLWFTLHSVHRFPINCPACHVL